jgi:hypothetical protein
MHLSGTTPNRSYKTLHRHKVQGQVLETFSLMSYQKRNKSSLFNHFTLVAFGMMWLPKKVILLVQKKGNFNTIYFSFTCRFSAN